MKYLSALLIVLGLIPALAQPSSPSRLDSLYSAARQSEDTDQKINLLIKYALQSPRNRVDSMKSIADRLEEISSSYEGIPISSIRNFILGAAFSRARNLDSAGYYMKLSKPGIEQLGDPVLTSDLYAGLASVFGRKRQSDSAIHYSKLALPLAQEHNKRILKKIYGNMGNYYRHAGAFEQSRQSFQNLMQLDDVNVFDSTIALMSIADIYLRVGDLPRSRATLFEAEKIAPENTQFKASIYNNIAESYEMKNNTDSALLFLNLGYDQIQRARNADQLILTNRLRAANHYLTLGELDKAKEAYATAKASPIRYMKVEEPFLQYVKSKILYKEGKYQEVVAIAPAVIAKIRVLEGFKLEGQFREYFKLVTDAYERLGDEKGAIATMKNYVAYLENTEIAKTRRELADLKVAYETQEKEQALARSTEALALNQKINILLTVSIIAIFLALLAVGFTYRSVRSKNRLLEDQNEKIKVLIRELHHRVKNNLQVISSLLGLQSLKIEGEEAKAAFDEGKSRVNAMAMIHKKLYQENDLEKVNINEYLEELINNLKFSFDTSSKVAVNMDVTQAEFNMDKAIPVGLILNELITNSFKYAFENIEKPILDIKLIQNQDQFELTISDNGKAIDQMESIEQSESFGLRLVNLLVNQLNGHLSFYQSANLKTFSIHFQ